MAGSSPKLINSIPIYSLNIYNNAPSKIKWRFRTNEKTIGEYYQHLSKIKTYCRSQVVVLFREDENKTHIRHHKVGCNSWDCPECRKKKALELRRRIQAATQNSNWRLATLTLEQNTRGSQDSLRILSQQWDVFLKKLRRRFDDLKIIRFIEFHDNGYPHIHFFCNHYIPQQLLSNLWTACGGGKIVDIRMVKNEKMLSYCIRYLSSAKDKHAQHDWKYFVFSIRRFNATRNFFIPSTPRDFVTLIKCTKYGDHEKQLQEFISYISKNYKTVCYLEPDEIWFFDPFT